MTKETASTSSKSALNCFTNMNAVRRRASAKRIRVAGQDKADASVAAHSGTPRNVGLPGLFLLFSQLGLSSFGGAVSAWMHRAFVEQRGWLGESEFAAALALSRIMPGANVVNLAILIGQKLRGWPGAVAAVLGLLVGPSLAVVALAVAYRQFAGTALVDAALEGAAAAAVGLLVAMGVRSGSAVIGGRPLSGRRAVRVAGSILVLLAAFVLIGVLRMPTVATVLCLAPLSIAFAWFMGAGPPADEPP
jgi:chromate transporter